MPAAEIRKFQLRKLKETVAWVYERVPFYRQKLDEKGVKPNSIKSLDDIARLSFTVKNDLRDNYPFGLCAVPLTGGRPGARLLGDDRQADHRPLHGR